MREYQLVHTHTNWVCEREKEREREYINIVQCAEILLDNLQQHRVE